MLIRWAQKEDIADWLQVAESVADLFDQPDMAADPQFKQFTLHKISRKEALAAYDRMAGQCAGFLAFSRAHNRITWLAVAPDYRGQGIGSRLLRCAINQMDTLRDISVIALTDTRQGSLPGRALYQKFGFVEDGSPKPINGHLRSPMILPASGKKPGNSFHYNFPRYAAWADPDTCPVCHQIPAPRPPVRIAEMPVSWLECYPQAQGRLYGKCHLLSKVHSEHFYDLSPEDMQAFMADLQRVARELHSVTGAIKINFEIHDNSMPHLHVHLFPRYLDDDFPSAPIDYRVTEPSPYRSQEEFNWFVSRMQKRLNS